MPYWNCNGDHVFWYITFSNAPIFRTIGWSVSFTPPANWIKHDPKDRLNRTWFWPNGHGSFVLLKLLARVRIRDLLVDYLSKEHPGFRLDVPSGNETWQWKILSGKIIYKYPYYGCSIPMVVVVILPCFFIFDTHQQPPTGDRRHPDTELGGGSFWAKSTLFDMAWSEFFCRIQ